jgi:hypothetical protein
MIFEKEILPITGRNLRKGVVRTSPNPQPNLTLKVDDYGLKTRMRDIIKKKGRVVSDPASTF